MPAVELNSGSRVVLTLPSMDELRAELVRLLGSLRPELTTADPPSAGGRTVRRRRW
ncbi:hypothetical protein GCM10010259_19990 [Streptomyces daghestanicus]|uniref:Uncharacterized protein n=1 Tax=Streptomyces daghestanicus TaxID=66885 RepID=A0ABQ3QC71_9ACTN|nr:hypothetical protein [Streptomyces daghestanicus]GGU29535.1 hypothetical protein GCM10010259_19990 [Streptomyces daghestanicus]GHI34863.1 hypothetical protein Sdagh_65930 [Streptomyces daghestanicus]